MTTGFHYFMNAPHNSRDGCFCPHQVVRPIHIFILVAFVVATPCHAKRPIVRDGSTIEKAIPLKKRGLKAVEEEMAWMTKLHHYTPLLATRDVIAEAVR